MNTHDIIDVVQRHLAGDRDITSDQIEDAYESSRRILWDDADLGKIDDKAATHAFRGIYFIRYSLIAPTLNIRMAALQDARIALETYEELDNA